MTSTFIIMKSSKLMNIDNSFGVIGYLSTQKWIQGHVTEALVLGKTRHVYNQCIWFHGFFFFVFYFFIKHVLKFKDRFEENGLQRGHKMEIFTCLDMLCSETINVKGSTTNQRNKNLICLVFFHFGLPYWTHIVWINGGLR